MGDQRGSVLAISNKAVFELRPGAGNDLNSGGFVITAGGSDSSQQNSPQVTFNGSTILAVTSGVSATITITGYTVLTTDVGNTLRIAGGTNFTAGLYQIISVNAGLNTWTLDRNCSSGVGAAMTGRMGGALATAAQFFADAAANTTPGGYVGWITGTLTVTTTVTLNTNYTNRVADGSTASTLGGLLIIGYGSVRGDNGKCTWTTATNSIDLITFSSNSTNVNFYNFAFTTSAGTVGYGATITGGNNPRQTFFDNCSWTGFKRNFFADIGSGAAMSGLHFRNCVVTACTTDGIVNNGLTVLVDCYVFSNTGDGVRLENGQSSSRGPLICIGSTFYNNTGKGIFWNSDSNIATAADGISIIINCNCVSNGSDGFRATPATAGLPIFWLQNNIFYGNGGFGVNCSILYGALMGSTNAYGANTSGPYGGTFTALPGDVTLSGDPFNGRTTNDFSLNSTAGAGAACNSAGFPGVLQGGGTGFASIGALTPSGGGGGTTVIVPGKTYYTFLGEEA